MNILITGCAGLIGSRLSDWIIEHHPEHNIVGIDDLSGGYSENIHPKVKLITANLIDYNLDITFSEFKFDIVYHFAAYAAEGLSSFIRTYNYNNNLLATINIINSCIKYNIKRLVFTSSMAVYGNGECPHDEKNQPLPIDPYGVAKYAAELDIQVAGTQHGLDWCIIRPHNVYGVKQNIWDKYRNVLGIWMFQHLNNQPMTIFGDGTQTRAFSNIDDCLEPLWKAGISEKASKQIINLGGSKFYTINEANHILRNIIGNGTTKYLESRHEAKNAYSTWEKSIDLLNYNETTTLKNGLKRMWDWAKIQPKRKQKIWDKYEIDKGIYEFWKIK